MRCATPFNLLTAMCSKPLKEGTQAKNFIKRLRDQHHAADALLSRKKMFVGLKPSDVLRSIN